ncbi:MAG: catechol 2,3-dioxygenase-like lactoylglutathione lyase family enzyme [Myxococcota bacterium]|jgi:catechol 2,3-dioxygenase-like lactoylglutathione lyase family enzyme
MSIELNGIAHIQLTVRDPAACIPFWEKLCGFLEMKTLIRNDDIIYCIGSRTGILVRAAAPEDKPDDLAFNQWRAGLHHFCLRARAREDVDAVHAFVTSNTDATIVHPPQEDAFAPGYYSVLFEDPEGIRIEINHVPGRGHLGEGGRLGEGGKGPASTITEEGLPD